MKEILEKENIFVMDEARAAQEIWTKIGDEVTHRKDMHASPYDESVIREMYEQSGQTPPARRGVPQKELEEVSGRELKGLPGGESEGATGKVSRSTPGRASRRNPRRISRRASGGAFGGILGIFNNTFSFIWNEFVLEHPFASLFFALVGTSLFLEFVFPSPQNGYYQVEDTVYYYLEDQWYMYDDSGDWVTSYVDLDDPEDYYLGDFYSEEYGTEAFEGTEYYGHYLEEKREKEKERENRDNDDYDNDYDDDDYDYDYDDWDADDTDWDTDW